MNTHHTSCKSFIFYLIILLVIAAAPMHEPEAAETAYQPPAWKGNVTLGGNWQTGNTERLNAAVGADAQRKSSKERYSLNFLFNYSEEDGTSTAESYYGSGKYDYFFDKHIYGYISLELLKDKFKDLSLRTVIGPGAGYQVWDEEKKSLLVEGGLAYFSNNYEVAEDDDSIAARLSAALMYKVMASLTLNDQLIIYTTFEDFGEFQLRNEAALSTPLASGWALKAVNILEYDSDPPAGIEETDLNWLLSLQYSF